MTLEEYFGNWLKVIDVNELNKIMGVIQRMKVPICPSPMNIFKAFEVCDYNNLKVVFIGQDPYPQKDVATGILFGNREGTELSPSLEIIKEASINLEVPNNSIIFDPTLVEWAKQGILMINSALTVEMNKIGSHVMLWRPFISSMLKLLSEWNPGLIYVLFGEQARTFRPYIGKNNIVLEEKHPAFYARMNSKMPSTIFEEVSRLTKEKYGEPIKWFKEY